MKSLLQLLSLKVYAARTTSADPVQKYNFRMTIPGLPTSIGWQKVSGLSEEVGVVEYSEGGYPHIHKLPGRPTVPEVTCERGQFADFDMRSMLQKTLGDANMRSTIIFEELDRMGRTVRTYKLAEAWVSKWEGSDFDATSDDAAIGKITIQFEYYL